MNQVKIGKFIAKLRKEKKMTQQELADLLNVTDRAISNWENGRRMPDVTFFKPLCEILDISVNELVAGERISKEDKQTLDKTSISLNSVKKDKKKTKCILLIVLLIVIFTLFIISCEKVAHSKIDLYNLEVSLTDEYHLNRQFYYRFNEKSYDIYYYGVSEVLLCDSKNTCYELEEALKSSRITFQQIKSYLDSQTLLSNIEEDGLYDGGTTIYQNAYYSVIFCNTSEGNKDIYFGESNMPDALEGSYCGHTNTIKDFKRTYHILNILEDGKFLTVTLKDQNEKTATVKILNSYNLYVGKNYEFSFYTNKKFEDKISNIFKYSTLLDIKETDIFLDFAVDEEIYVNSPLTYHGTLNEIEGVYMQIKDKTLTKTGATIVITDLSGKNNIYGKEYRLDKKEDGKWQELEVIYPSNYIFDSIGYLPDRNHKLVLEVDWEDLYGSLSSGEYRLVKSTSGPNEQDKYYFSVEFEIT